MQGFLTLLVLGFLGFVGFAVYFFFKQLQFVLLSVNLYKKMVRRQETIIKLLLDIRDNTKKVEENSLQEDDDSMMNVNLTEKDLKRYCPSCNTFQDAGKPLCPKCGFNLRDLKELPSSKCVLCNERPARKYTESFGWVCWECENVVEKLGEDKGIPK
jgi:predicted Zn-ribbon and HTH transcriptional regulator